MAGEPSPTRTRVMLLGVATVSGGAVLAAETGVLRVLAPYFGSSTLVWINVIGVVLAALAVGYWLGGMCADRMPRTGPFLCCVAAGAAGLVVAPYLVKPLAGALVPAVGVPLPSLGGLLVWGSLVSAVLLLAPPVALLGLVGPWVTRLLVETGMPVGRASGHVLAWSTVGSLVGTYVPTLLLVPMLGARASVAISGIVLLAATLVAARWPRARAAGGAAGCLALLGGAVGVEAALPIRGGVDLVAEAESPYQYLRVARGADGAGSYTKLTLNEGREDYHSLVRPGRAMVDAYYDWFVPLAGLAGPVPDPAAPPPLRVAVLGLAAGSHSRALHAFCGRGWTLAIDGVEIDPAVIAMAREHLGLTAADHPRLTIHAADARPWLAAAPGPYHLIIVDAFAQQLYVPFHLATVEFFRVVHAKLDEGGCLAFNVFPARADSALVNALGATLREVFGRHVWAARLSGTGNYLVCARKAGLLDRDALLRVHGLAMAAPAASHPAADLDALSRVSAQLIAGFRPVPDQGPVLTDDRAPVEWLTDQDCRRLRAEALGEAR